MFLGAEREARKGFTVKQPKQISDKTEHPRGRATEWREGPAPGPRIRLKRIRKQGAMGSH